MYLNKVCLEFSFFKAFEMKQQCVVLSQTAFDREFNCLVIFGEHAILYNSNRNTCFGHSFTLIHFYVSSFFLWTGAAHRMQVPPILLVSILGVAASGVSGVTIDPGMMGMSSCCIEKVVGGITYIIVEENTGKTQGYGCSEDCVYIRMDETGGQMYCFSPGNLEVACNSSSGTPEPPPPPYVSPSTPVTSAPFALQTTSPSNSSI